MIDLLLGVVLGLAVGGLIVILMTFSIFLYSVYQNRRQL